jgi:hypothetical protein
MLLSSRITIGLVSIAAIANRIQDTASRTTSLIDLKLRTSLDTDLKTHVISHHNNTMTATVAIIVNVTAIRTKTVAVSATTSLIGIETLEPRTRKSTKSIKNLNTT